MIAVFSPLSVLLILSFVPFFFGCSLCKVMFLLAAAQIFFKRTYDKHINFENYELRSIVILCLEI